MSGEQETRFLLRPGGRLAYDVRGEGPPIVCVPGVGDVRSHYDALGALLVEHGMTAVSADLRGHGDSDGGFEAYDLQSVADDCLALIDAVGGRAVLMAHGLAAAAAVLAAAGRGRRVAGLVLLSPRVRPLPISLADRTLGAAARWGPWGKALWASYYRSLYPGRPPANLPEHVRRIRQALGRPGHWAAYRAMSRLSPAPAAAALERVRCRVLVVAGVKDRDRRDVAGEARWLAQQVRGHRVIVPEAGHYPEAEYPEIVGPEVVRFASKLQRG